MSRKELEHGDLGATGTMGLNHVSTIFEMFGVSNDHSDPEPWPVSWNSKPLAPGPCCEIAGGR